MTRILLLSIGLTLLVAAFLMKQKTRTEEPQNEVLGVIKYNQIDIPVFLWLPKTTVNGMIGGIANYSGGYFVVENGSWKHAEATFATFIK